MARLLIRLRAASDLHLGTKKPYGQFLETETYIAGRTLRGALAAVFLADCPPGQRPGRVVPDFCKDCPLAVDGTCRFDDLFTEAGTVRFEHCYPEYQEQQAVKIPPETQVLPFTARSCKVEPGFSSGHDYAVEQLATRLPSQARPHGVFDVLIPHLVYHELDRRAGPLPLVWADRCPECLSEADPFPGMYETLGDPPRIYYQPRVHTRRSSKTAISRARQAAQVGQLFSVELVDEGQQFVGSVLVSDGLEDAVREGLVRLAQRGGLGGRAGRGLGRVELTGAVTTLGEESAADVQARLERFNALLAEHWREWRTLASADAPAEPPSTYFTLDLQSEALLPDGWGRPTLALEAEELTRLLRASLPEASGTLPGLEVAGRYVAPVRVSGWSAAWRLPREVRLAAAAGSVFVFRSRVPCEGETLVGLARALAGLQARGLGSGGQWGLGRVRVCHPFHLEVTPV